MLHGETNNLWSLWRRLNNETGLTVTTMGSLIQRPHLCALQSSVFCLYNELCGFHSSGISIDHEELLLRYPGAVNWHKIPQRRQKKKKTRHFMSTETEL